jgi:hypothetical protein
MTRPARIPRIVFAMLCAVWCVNHSALAYGEFEIESFTRYRIDRFDNNNTGPTMIDELQSQLATFSSKSESAMPGSTTVLPSSSGSPSASSITSYNIIDYTGSVHVGFDNPSSYMNNFPDSIGNPQSSYTIASDYGLGDISHLVDLDFRPTLYPQTFGNSYMQSSSMQLEKVIRFTPKVAEDEKQDWTDENYTEVYGGVRHFQLVDTWLFGLSTRLDGNIWMHADSENLIPGLHFGANWSYAREAWQVTAGGFVQAGQYLCSATVVNSPNLFSTSNVDPSWLADSDKRDFITLLSVAQAQASHAITKDVTFHLGCTANYIGDIRYAVDTVNTSFPGGAVRDTATDDLFITTVYTSLEFKR